MRLPRPTPKQVVDHSPTPSMVRIAASSKGDGKEGAGRVRLVVIGEDVAAAILALECLADQPRNVQLLFQPHRDGLAEGEVPAGRHGEIGFQQAFELGDRLVVEADVIEIRGRDARLAEAVIDGVLREIGVVLLAREAFFLGGGNDPAIDHQGRRRVVIKCRNAQDRRHP